MILKYNDCLKEIEINCNCIKARILEVDTPRIISRDDTAILNGKQYQVVGWSVDLDDPQYSWIDLEPIEEQP